MKIMKAALAALLVCGCARPDPAAVSGRMVAMFEKMERTGVLEWIAEGIALVSNGNVYVMLGIILWVSAIASAFVDNIPFAATMIPVIRMLSLSSSVPLATLAWTLSIGTDIGGSATPIGASANVVGTAVAMKAGYPIGWGKYCKYCVPATLLVIGIAMICVFVRYV